MSNPTLIDLILGGVSSGMAQVEVAMDVEVLSFDASAMTADVRPCVRASRIGEDGVVEAPEAPTIYAVPVRWPSAGGRSITWGLAAGDIVTAVIRSRSHDEVDSGGAVPTTPAASRRFSWSDAVIWPSGIRSGSVPAAGFRGDGQPVWRLPSGEAVFVGASTASKALALARETADRIERIEAYLNTATYLTPAGATTAPTPPPFTGTTSLLPLCTASVVLGSVAATTEAAVRSTRLKVDT